MPDLLTPEEIAALRARAERAEAERNYYRKAIQDFQDGNYAHPRAFRKKDVGQGVGKCCHGTWYFEECESCNSEHFDNALTNGPAAQSTIAELTGQVERLREANDALQEAFKKVQAAYAAVDSPAREFPAPAFDIALDVRHEDCHKAADAFWQYWRENGETHKHGYYESTWGAINRALRMVGVTEHEWKRAALGGDS